ncbi:COG1361 S-layer family protein [Methanolobus chelungpuianus]|uniref:S-layer protein n=1 Tax=Methanolobus chelungpuianus TaxID=502115 RepID=A0AAE3H9C7_9EURY|nr:hypothetical protein [Methanolobus chelungpuianus]MCQ6962028.1 hypothetical protein [Methanolobus chelungpuianus]
MPRIGSLKKATSIFILMIIIMQAVVPAGAQMAVMDIKLPDFFNFDENYYTVYGGPDVSATFVGSNEFSRGDKVSINLNLINKGVITGFKSETRYDSVSTLDQKIQQAEMGYESQRTTAIGIVAVLNSSTPYIKVKSGPQEAGTLPSGQQVEDPIKFNIEISKNAPAGTYPLRLDLFYGYQENVQISGDDETDLGITNMEVGLWYAVGHQNQTVNVIVKDEAKFEVVDVEGDLYANQENLLYVIFRNSGEEPVKDAIVRISADTPFSTTDDQAFLGSLAPGETARALFRLKVDESAVPKDYAINSEIRYEDSDGHSRISDTLKIRTQTLPARSAFDGLAANAGILAVIVLALVAVAGYFVYGRFLKKKE